MTPPCKTLATRCQAAGPTPSPPPTRPPPPPIPPPPPPPPPTNLARLIRVVQRPAGTQPSFSNLDGARRSVERQEEEDEAEGEEVKEEEEEEEREEEKKNEEVVGTRPPVGTVAPINYVKRARARRLARLEEQRQLDLMRGKCPAQDEENEELIADCFCGGCSGAFIANSDTAADAADTIQT